MGKKSYMGIIITAIIVVLFIVGLVLALYINYKVRNYVIPNTGLTIIEVIKIAIKPYRVELYVSILSLSIGYILLYFKK